MGVIDLDVNDKARVMAAGLFAFGDKKPTTIYIDKIDVNSDNIIYKLLEKMFEPKYDNYLFYCDNLDDFDAIFLLKAILSYNKENLENPYEIENLEKPYKIKNLCRKDKILKLTITKKVNNKIKKVKIVDSYAILTDS